MTEPTPIDQKIAAEHGALYDSARDYFAQLEAYKTFQRKPANHRGDDSDDR